MISHAQKKYARSVTEKPAERPGQFSVLWHGRRNIRRTLRRRRTRQILVVGIVGVAGHRPGREHRCNQYHIDAILTGTVNAAACDVRVDGVQAGVSPNLVWEADN